MKRMKPGDYFATAPAAELREMYGPRALDLFDFVTETGRTERVVMVSLFWHGAPEPSYGVQYRPWARARVEALHLRCLSIVADHGGEPSSDQSGRDPLALALWIRYDLSGGRNGLGAVGYSQTFRFPDAESKARAVAALDAARESVLAARYRLSRISTLVTGSAVAAYNAERTAHARERHDAIMRELRAGRMRRQRERIRAAGVAS